MFSYLTRHPKRCSPLVAAGLCAAALLTLAPRYAAAQAARSKAPPAGSKAASTTPSPPKAAAKVAPQQAEDAAARDRVLQSKDWQDTMREFKKWLSTQSLYDADQVEQIKVRLDRGIKRMTSAQLHLFMSSMRPKMNVLTSERAQDAQAHLSETFEVASPAYAKRIRQRLPDPLSASAAQIEHSLTMLVSKRQNTIDMQKSFDFARQQIVANNQAQVAARQQAQARERTSAESEGPPTPRPTRFDYPIGDAFNTGWDGQAGVTWDLNGSRF
jgi:hypothetical protein